MYIIVRSEASLKSVGVYMKILFRTVYRVKPIQDACETQTFVHLYPFPLRLVMKRTKAMRFKEPIAFIG